jgi:hypothetical protein
MVEDRVLVKEYVSERRRTWVIISLEGGMSSPNPYATEGCKHNLPTVPYVDYYYPKYSHDARFNWDEQILVNEDSALLRNPSGSNRGCEKSMQETR